MSIYEYDEEKHMRQTREEGFEDGFDKGFDSGFGSGFNEGEIAGSIKAYQTMSVSRENTMDKIMQIYSLSHTEAELMMQKYWVPDKN